MTGAPPPPIVEVLRALLRSRTALQGGLAPLVANAATVVRDLQERHPEAFDADGALRPDWRDIAQEAAARRSPPPVIHAHLLTRRIPICLN